MQLQTTTGNVTNVRLASCEQMRKCHQICMVLASCFQEMSPFTNRRQLLFQSIYKQQATYLLVRHCLETGSNFSVSQSPNSRLLHFQFITRRQLLFQPKAKSITRKQLLFWSKSQFRNRSDFLSNQSHSLETGVNFSSNQNYSLITEGYFSSNQSHSLERGGNFSSSQSHSVEKRRQLLVQSKSQYRNRRQFLVQSRSQRTK